MTRAKPPAPIPLNPAHAPSLFDRAGGEAALRLVVDDFVERMFADVMIGFFFRNTDRTRLKDLEFQFAARSLGADVVYEGRPLQAAHARHPIMGGQFARRVMLLRNACDDHGLLAEARDALLAHVEQLRPLVVKQAASSCVAPAAAPGPLVSHVPVVPRAAPTDAKDPQGPVQ